MKKGSKLSIILGILLFFVFGIVQAQIKGDHNFQDKKFPLVLNNKAVPIMIDPNDAKVVGIAAKSFASDIEMISGIKPEVSLTVKAEYIIIAGTIGQSKILNKLSQKLKQAGSSKIENKWEAFMIVTINAPLKGVKKALVVVGSDRRGTAYGILELSRMIGISPWVWWADVQPTKKSELTLDIPKPIFQQPSVQYRGIFLNDEDWGLKPWASKTIEPETGEIGPKTYGKIFELLLRLRANTIWPAMHECTTPFYFVKGNAAMADSFGIIVSTSHCEPLMRSNPLEWDHKTRGDYNFFTNKKNVVDYWNERLTETSKFENTYTVGMRGIHDGAMEGAKTIAQQVEGLTDVFKVQREMLGKSLNKDADKIPQIFIPYKEVLDAYDAGLKVPEDVTLVWCDDNYGYMKRLSNEAERQRKGGSGVYYHISYWGRPHDYLWLGTTQPSFIWQEMQKAWAYGACKMWILNVGDIKPAEYLTEFYLDMAWNINAVKSDQISQHLENWMGKNFGVEHASGLKDIMDEYYRLAFIRRPEFMGWSQTEPITKTKSTELNFSEFGDEINTRLKQYDRIEKQADSVSKYIPAALKNAYFELVNYPVAGAAEMNKKWLNSQYANIFSAFQLLEANTAREKSLQAWTKIQQMTSYYNDSIENGKWKYMMSAQPRELPVFDKPIFAEFATTTQPGTIFWPEGSNKPMVKGDTAHLVLDNCTKGIYCFNGNSFTITGKPDWLAVEQISAKGSVTLPADKLSLSVIANKLPGNSADGLLTLKTNENNYYIAVKAVFNSTLSAKNNCIQLNASAFTQNRSTDFCHWQSIEGLGYSRSAMLLQPFEAKLHKDISENPALEYEFTISQADSAYIRLYLLPTHPADSRNDLRIAVSVDNSAPQLFNIKTEGRSSAWKENVLRNQTIVKIPWKFSKAGKHVVRIIAVDPDVILDQLLIDFKTDRQFYGVGL